MRFSTATNAALQYTNSPYYTSGFADLYTYGAFHRAEDTASAGGLSASAGWSPFSAGQMDVGSLVRLDVDELAAVGLGSVSLRRLALRCRLRRLVLFATGVLWVAVRSKKAFPRGVHPPRPLYQPATGGLSFATKEKWVSCRFILWMKRARLPGIWNTGFSLLPCRKE